MPVPNSHDLERLIDSNRATIRRISDDVLPRAEGRIERSVGSLIESMEHELGSTERLLKKTDD